MTDDSTIHGVVSALSGRISDRQASDLLTDLCRPALIDAMVEAGLTGKVAIADDRDGIGLHGWVAALPADADVLVDRWVSNRYTWDRFRDMRPGWFGQGRRVDINRIDGDPSDPLAFYRKGDLVTHDGLASVLKNVPNVARFFAQRITVMVDDYHDATDRAVGYIQAHFCREGFRDSVFFYVEYAQTPGRRGAIAPEGEVTA